MKAVIRLKGGPGSGNRGHSGRPGKVGGSSEGSIFPAEHARDFAEKYRKLNNKYATLFTKAFNAVGARMWRDDYAHKIPVDAVDYIADQITGKPVEYVRKYYTRPYRPLTVLHSYPNVTKPQRKQLDAAVDELHAAHTKALQELLGEYL